MVKAIDSILGLGQHRFELTKPIPYKPPTPEQTPNPPLWMYALIGSGLVFTIFGPPIIEHYLFPNYRSDP